MRFLECRSIKDKELSKLKLAIKEDVTLAVIQIGLFKENQVYLKSKRNLLSSLGIKMIEFNYDENNDKEEIVSKIIQLNNDNSVNGIMIQKPILSKFDYQELVDYIDYRKDVDGVSSLNIDRLKENKECIIPCTVRAVLKVFEEYQISINNRRIVIIGKSNLVGMPLYQILKKDNEVILCDSKTTNIKDIINDSEIIISSIGKANYFNKDYFKDGQVIIDVGTNYVDGKLVGDVDVETLIEKDVMITPVPGGVGQLTPIYLVYNLAD